MFFPFLEKLLWKSRNHWNLFFIFYFMVCLCCFCLFCLLFLTVHLSWILFSWMRCGIRLTEVFLVHFFFCIPGGFSLLCLFGLYYLFHLLWGGFYFVCGSWGRKASFSEAEPLRGCLSSLLPIAMKLAKTVFLRLPPSVNCLWSWSRSSKAVGEVKVIHMWLHLHINFLRRVGKDHDVHSF